ncbi:MAG: hypothetical protein AAFX94_17530 [Myxococcota bacterium]
MEPTSNNMSIMEQAAAWVDAQTSRHTPGERGIATWREQVTETPESIAPGDMFDAAGTNIAEAGVNVADVATDARNFFVHGWAAVSGTASTIGTNFDIAGERTSRGMNNANDHLPGYEANRAEIERRLAALREERGEEWSAAVDAWIATGASIHDAAFDALAIPVDLMEGLFYGAVGTVGGVGYGLVGGVASLGAGIGDTAVNIWGTGSTAFLNIVEGAREGLQDAGRGIHNVFAREGEEITEDAPPEYREFKGWSFPMAERTWRSWFGN